MTTGGINSQGPVLFQTPYDNSNQHYLDNERTQDTEEGTTRDWWVEGKVLTMVACLNSEEATLVRRHLEAGRPSYDNKMTLKGGEAGFTLGGQ